MLKFCYEFIDTNTKKCVYYNVDVVVGKHYEWVLGADRGPQATMEIRNEKEIMDKVDRLISQALFKTDEIPNEYELHELCEGKKKKSVKVRQQPNMLVVADKFKCSYKYCKGPMPESWTDIFTYSMKDIHCKYSYTNNDLVPVETKANCHVSSDQYGGNYEHNYKEQKYRHKYHEASRALKKMRQ